MAQNDFNESSSVFPVNEMGEIVFTSSGIGSTNIVGFVPSNSIPQDIRTGRIRAVFGPAATETASVGNDLTFYVKEGSQVKFTSNSATGTITKYVGTSTTVDITQVVATGNVFTYGNYVGTQKFVVTVTAGSVDAVTGAATLGINLPRNMNTFALIGDSKAALWKSSAALNDNLSSKGFVTWWLAFSNQAWSLAGDFSTGGSRFGAGGNLPSISSQIDLAVATNAGNLIMEGGLNDITGGIPLATLQALQLTAIKKATDAGMRVFWGTIAPLINPTSGYNSIQQRLIQQQNTWIRDQINPPNGKPGLNNVVLWDYYAAMIDPFDSTNGNARAGWYTDGIHEATVGGRNAGRSLSVVTKPYQNPIGRLLSSNVDSKTFNPDSTNLYDNGLFVTGSGTATGFAVGGAAAGTTTKTLVARADGFGNDQTLTCTMTNSGDGVILNCPNVFTLGAIGKTYVVECEMTLSSPVNINQLTVTVSAIGNLATQTSTWCSDVSSTMYEEGFTVQVKTFPMTVNAAIGTMSQLKAQISCTSGAASGSCVLKVGRLSFREVTL